MTYHRCMDIGTGEIIGAIGITLLAGNAFFLSRHFSRTDKLEDRQHRVETSTEVTSTKIDGISGRLKNVEARVNTIYQLLMEPKDAP